MCHNYALASGPPWFKLLPRLLSPFCCSWAPNDDVTAILPVVFSYHTLESLYVICHVTVVFSYHALESLYVICHVTVCPFKLVKGSVYGFRTSFRTFDSLGCDFENVECLKRDVYYCNIYMYLLCLLIYNTCSYCVFMND